MKASRGLYPVPLEVRYYINTTCHPTCWSVGLFPYFGKLAHALHMGTKTRLVVVGLTVNPSNLNDVTNAGFQRALLRPIEDKMCIYPNVSKLSHFCYLSNFYFMCPADSWSCTRWCWQRPCSWVRGWSWRFRRIGNDPAEQRTDWSLQRTNWVQEK